MTASYVRRMVCLANSRKLGGWCLAGREIVSGEAGKWVRPVSARQSGELAQNECWYGKEPLVAVGDIFRISLKGAKQHSYQPENEIIDPEYYCAFEEKMSWHQILKCVDLHPGLLWLNGHTTRYGLNDKLPAASAPSLNHSLKLIRVYDFKIIIAHEWPEFDNKRSIRGSFSVSGYYYILMVTDPQIEAEFAENADGHYVIGEAVLCLSLGEPYKDEAYKLVAAVIRKGFCGIV